MSRFFLFLTIVSLALSSTHGRTLSRQAATPETGLSVDEFRKFANTLPSLAGRIHAVRFFAGPKGNFPGGIALALLTKTAGWQIHAFLRGADQKFHWGWSSGKLEDTFSSSSGEELRIVNLGTEDAVQFEGCVTHVCSDVFSILLFVPSKTSAFKIHYSHGKTTYSPTLELPENRTYRNWLDQQVKDRAGIGE